MNNEDLKMSEAVLRQHLERKDIRDRQDFEFTLNRLLESLKGFYVERVRIDEAKDNEDGMTRLVVLNDDGTESRINITANSTGATMRVFCAYIANGDCQGLYMNHGRKA